MASIPLHWRFPRLSKLNKVVQVGRPSAHDHGLMIYSFHSQLSSWSRVYSHWAQRFVPFSLLGRRQYVEEVEHWGDRGDQGGLWQSGWVALWAQELHTVALKWQCQQHPANITNLLLFCKFLFRLFIHLFLFVVVYCDPVFCDLLHCFLLCRALGFVLLLCMAVQSTAVKGGRKKKVFMYYSERHLHNTYHVFPSYEGFYTNFC